MHVTDTSVAPVAAVAAPSPAPIALGQGPIPAYGSDQAQFNYTAAPAPKAEKAGTMDKLKAWWKGVYRSDENISAWKSFESDMEKRPQAYIKPGEKGPKVTQFQEKMRALGVDTNVNGVHGPATQSLVQEIKAQLGIDDGYLDADGNPVRSGVVTPLLQSKINALLGQKQGQVAPTGQPAPNGPVGPAAETVTPEEEAEWQAAKEKMAKFGYKPSGAELQRLQDIERRINARNQAEAQAIAAAKAKIEAMIAADGPVGVEELSVVQPYIMGLQAGTVQQEPLLDKLVMRLQERAQKYGVTKEAAELEKAPQQPQGEEIPDVPVMPYTIKPGDTKQSIAAAHGISLDALKAANPNARWVVGATIKVPQAEIPDEAPVAPVNQPMGTPYPVDQPASMPQMPKPPIPATAKTPAGQVLQLTLAQMKENVTWSTQMAELNLQQGVPVTQEEKQANDAVIAQWKVVEPILAAKPDQTAGPVQPARPIPALANASFSQTMGSQIGTFKETLDWAFYTYKHRVLAKAPDLSAQEKQAVANVFKNFDYLKHTFSNGQIGSPPPGEGPGATAMGGTVKIKVNPQDPRVQILIGLFEKKKSGQPLTEEDHRLYESTMQHYRSSMP